MLPKCPPFPPTEPYVLPSDQIKELLIVDEAVVVLVDVIEYALLDVPWDGLGPHGVILKDLTELSHRNVAINLSGILRAYFIHSQWVSRNSGFHLSVRFQIELVEYWPPLLNGYGGGGVGGERVGARDGAAEENTTAVNVAAAAAHRVLPEVAGAAERTRGDRSGGRAIGAAAATGTACTERYIFLKIYVPRRLRSI